MIAWLGNRSLVCAAVSRATLAAVLLFVLHREAFSDTIQGALVQAYQSNPQLNAQRAQVRSADEAVPQALSGYRPTVTVNTSLGYQYTDTLSTQGGSPTQLVRTDIHGANPPRSAGITINQTLFNGNQTANRTRAAEAQVSGSREGLRVLEQTVLFNAASIYMDYLRDSAIVEVNKSNVRVLEQTLKQTRDRFNVGEVTRTDVAQSEAQLAAGKTQELTAESNLNTTRSNYRRIIGSEPQNLAPGSPVDRFLPPSLTQAVDISLIENPNVTAAMYGIDVNFLTVKVNEGALLWRQVRNHGGQVGDGWRCHRSSLPPIVQERFGRVVPRRAHHAAGRGALLPPEAAAAPSGGGLCRHDA